MFGVSVRIKIIIGVLVILASISLGLKSLKQEILDIYPLMSQLELSTYTDAEDPLKVGDSKVVQFTSSPIITFAALIGTALDYPYAGFRITASEKEPFIDIRNYDQIEITVDSTTASFFILDLTTYIDGYSHFNDLMSFRHHTAEIFTKAEPQTITIPMRSIPTQGWWYNLRKLNPKELGRPDFSKCHTISFEINAVKPGDEPLYMAVSSIRFINTNRKFVWIALSIFLMYVLFMVIDGRPRKKSRPILVKNTDLKDSLADDVQKIEEIIASQYTMPELGIAMVSREIGISTDRISVILQKCHAMSFKQYLNMVRITESKRLLLETDRNVSEIALAVGYNYPTTFNRVFKEVIGISPTDFRKKGSLS